jgi:hypothetical protein
MPERLDEHETAWFGGRLLTPQSEKKRQWEYTRVESKALGAPGLIAPVEAGLEAHGAATKVIPPEHVLADEATSQHETVLRKRVR